jgi:hypothetical protein
MVSKCNVRNNGMTLSHFARELMTINRQNGCFVPFYTMVVSPSMFSHSRFILLGFLAIRLVFLKTYWEISTSFTNVNQTTFTRNAVHTRFLRFIYAVFMCTESSKQFVFAEMVYLNTCFIPQNSFNSVWSRTNVWDKQTTDIQSSAVYFVVFS